MIHATVWGGAGEHGRSSYFIRSQAVSVLFDCGVKKEGDGVYPNIVPQDAAALTAVFLSHAHEDHSIALPLLYKFGYTGVVWTTRATAAQLPPYFAAWSAYAASRSAELPYDEDDVAAIRFAYLDDAAAPGEWFEAGPNLRVCWGRSGHMLGAVWLMAEMDGERVFFSGDYTAESLLLGSDAPPQLSGKDAPLLGLVDAAYGTDGESQMTKLERLAEVLAETVRQGGIALLPVPVYGRGQELLVWLTERYPDRCLWVEGEIVDGLRQLLSKPGLLREGAVERAKRALSCGRLYRIDSLEERERALASGENGIVLTNDGMMQSAKAQWYYRKLCGSPANAVVLTGHLAAGSFGKNLLETESAKANPQEAARVLMLRWKVHQGIGDVRSMLNRVNCEHTVLVHASREATDRLTEALTGEGYRGLYSLQAGDSLSLSRGGAIFS
ncbi:MBL fold metallo-hydrolase [Paenibacillus thalictri]|nr:MBL fold metallo-hydrolase [Paenibacillus thalictri]